MKLDITPPKSVLLVANGDLRQSAMEISSPNALAISTSLNGERVQGLIALDIIFDVPAIIELITGSSTLVHGAVILACTNQGAGISVEPKPRWLRRGDSVNFEFEKIGKLTNRVAQEDVVPRVSHCYLASISSGFARRFVN